MSSYDERTEGHHQQGLQTPDEITSAAAIDGQPTRSRRPGVSEWLSGKWRAMGGGRGGRATTHRDTNYLSSSLPVLDVQDESTSTVKDTSGRKSKLSWSKVKKRLTESLSHVGGSSSSRHAAGGSSCPAEEAAAAAAAITKRALPPVPPAPEQLRMPPLPLLEGGRSSSAASPEESHWTTPPPLEVAAAASAAAGADSNAEEEELQGAAMAAFFPAPVIDFATSIEKVKSYGWYWGPISRLASERLLADQPDGSFIVRDSSADHYIFSLTFKLDNKCSHVRIENHHGNFSFGSLQNFKSNTIVDFIENAVEHSRSGRYLFFLHRRPQRGPMRVQLLNPVSRFKTKDVQSLQHMCRFVILKRVPRDLLPELQVPKRILAYLDTPFYYSEQIADWADLEPAAQRGRQPSTSALDIAAASEEATAAPDNTSSADPPE